MPHDGTTHRRFRRRASLIAALLVALSWPARARADDLDDFAYALSAYLNSDHGSAVARFRPLVASQPPLLRHDLVQPARRYYAASLALSNQEPEAVRVMEEILRDDPDARFDPVQFSGIVVRLFEATRDRMAPELSRIRAARLAMLRADVARLDAQRAALRELETRERTIVRVDRAPMFAPFGIGQFVNGQIGLGVMFAAIDTLALAATYVTAVALIDIDLPDSYRSSCHVTACLPLIVGFWSGVYVFGASTVIGVIQANAAYRGDRVEVHTRPPPPLLRDLHLSIAPAAGGRGALAGLALRF